MNIEQLRKSRKADFGKIVKEFENTTNKPYQDDRFWKPERDKAGNATATIRFLNAGPDDELPWVKIFSHGFQGPSGRWYIENSLTTLGKPDPVAEYNVALWNSTSDDNSPERKRVRDQKRKLSYISNVLVVSDPKHPENNGKVFLYKYGKKIFDKIMDKARPTFEDEEPVNVFDFWEGANFKLRLKTVERFPNYDSSEFESPTPIADSDEEILEIANKMYRLGEFLEESNFKTYEELKNRLNMVLGEQRAPSSMSYEEEKEPTPMPVVEASTPRSVIDDDDTDMIAYFKELAEN